MCMMNAELRESQIGDLRRSHGAAMIDAPYRVTGGTTHWPYLTLMTRPTFCRKDNDRTGHLTTSDLTECVNTGSPKRVSLRYPVWRRSRHISQMPRVMSGTATYGWTGMGETNRATGWGIPSARVKGGAFAELGRSMTEVC